MTPGTSPQWGSPSARTAAVERTARAAFDFRAWRPQRRLTAAGVAKAAAALYLAALGTLVLTAWGDQGTAGGGLHLAFMMATGAAAALFTLGAGTRWPGEPAAAAPATQQTPAGLSELMAQMSHELRTPLNAVIGFSEVMRHELHGPLGHARYQEYAAHICESGGRLLSASEAALAAMETMADLMAEGTSTRHERLVAGSLVRNAWRSATAGAPETHRLSATACAMCDIVGERRGLAQALEHLLREAIARTPAGSVVGVRGGRRGSARSLEVRIGGNTGSGTSPSLRLFLSQLLLETQGATLTTTAGEDGSWSALIEFPGKR
jgi:two-component system cell cycle sensor histidine kinase PleC